MPSDIEYDYVVKLVAVILSAAVMPTASDGGRIGAGKELADDSGATSFDGVEACAVDMLGLVVRIREVGGFAETIFIESYDAFPKRITQKARHLIAMTVGHHDDEISGVEQLFGHGHGLASHLISMLGGDTAHDGLPVEAMGYFRSARSHLHALNAIICNHFLEHGLDRRRPTGVAGTYKDDLHTIDFVSLSPL